MAEIKTNFIRGRMNKDLDERLVPKGEYRDARNVEVSTSEGSNVGTVQNILGNLRVDTSVSGGFTTVGHIADEANNKLYWLCSSFSKDIIVEWDASNEVSSLVFVDTKKQYNGSCLRFDQKIITGINIIDDFLLFTDGFNEPKKINIRKCKIGTIDINTHTKLIVKDTDTYADNKGDIREENITVIKKKPNQHLSVKINEKQNSKEKGIFEKVFPRFSYRYKYSDNEYSAFGPFTNPVFAANHTDLNNPIKYYDTKEGHNTSMLNTIESIELFNFINEDTPRDVVAIDIIYKKDDSNVVYTVATLKVDDEEYNIVNETINGDEIARGKYVVTTENIYAAINQNQIIRNYDNVPRKALAQEIIGNRIVYANYTQGYDIGDTTIKLNSSYENRDFTNSLNNNYYDFEHGGLPSIKAQRDYQVGVVFGDKYGRETPVFTSNNGSVIVPWLNENGDSSPSYLSSLIINSNLSRVPDWADYYKFYIKETSGEYYNLLMDKVYIPSFGVDYENKENHVYLSFPSSEINKVQEDSYIILKKVFDNTSKPVEEVNRYKVVDIKEEAPDSIKYVYLPVGDVSNEDLDTTLANATDAASLFQNPLARIDKEVDSIEFDKSTWFGFGYPVLRGTGSNSSLTSGIDNTEFQKNIYISWKTTSAQGLETHSKMYRAVSIEVTDSFVLKLEEKISLEDATLATNTSDADKLNPDLTFSVFRKEEKDGEDFSGKFFVKVVSDDILTKNLLKQNTNFGNSRFISSSNDMFWWTSPISVYENDGINNLVFSLQNEPETTIISVNGAGSQNSASEWDFLLTDYGKYMFIDNMYLTSSNFSSNNHAKDSGQPFIANELSYASVEWNTEFEGNWNIDADTTWSQADISIGLNDWLPNVVNGLPGIKEVDDSYENGISSWRKDIYSQDISNTYEDGGYYMHLSFFAPGKDLHDGDFGEATPLANVDVFGENSIAGLLKGIWGGGVFTPEDGGDFGILDGQNIKYVEFESNYAGEDALAEKPRPGVGKGYDINYREQHERQWDPTYSPNNVGLEEDFEKDEKLEKFISNLAAGKKFKFAADTSGEIYTILDVKVKHIYNHTPWRSRYQATPDGIVRSGDSVESAAARWAKAKIEGTDQTADPEIGNSTPAEYLTSRIVAFSKASNRRTCYILRLDKNPASGDYGYNPVSGNSGAPDLDTSTKIEFIDDVAQSQAGLVRNTSAIFETEPKESIDLNIFYEASQAIPTYLTMQNVSLLAPVGSKVEMFHLPQAKRGQHIVTEDLFVSKWEETADGKLYFEVKSTNDDDNQLFNSKNAFGVDISYSDVRVRFYRENGSYTSCRLLANDDSLTANVSSLTNNRRKAFVVSKVIDPTLNVGIDWFNCFSFGDGVESDRIRDDFNAPTISNGAKASTTLDESYDFEERRKYGLIYSGIFNSNSSVNNLNQFIAGEKITKELNPSFGSIQKLYSRQSDLIAFCEDRVVKILANKDALFNADGNVNLVSTENVLGQAAPFVGEYGISQNPESFAKESYRAYFTDKNRGAVLRLSMDGLTPISEAGMHDWFRDNMPSSGSLIGTYDDYKRQYNLTFADERFNNILFNSYITQGESLSSTITESQLLPGGDLDSAETYELVNVNSLYESSDSNINQSNQNINATTEIINWPGIPKAVVSTYFDNTDVTSSAILTYDEVTTVYTDVLGNVNASGNNYVTNIDPNTGATPLIDAYNENAILGDLPDYGDHGVYICRRENFQSGDNMFSQNSGNDQYLDGISYYKSSNADNITFQSDLDGVDSGVLTQNTSFNTDSLSGGFYAPYSAQGENGTFYVNSNSGSFLDYGSNAALSIEPNAYSRTVFSGEEVVVKINYRLRKVGGTNNDDFINPTIKVSLTDGTSSLSGVKSEAVQGGSSSIPDAYFSPQQIEDGDPPIFTLINDTSSNYWTSGAKDYTSDGYTQITTGIGENQTSTQYRHLGSSCVTDEIELNADGIMPYAYGYANSSDFAGNDFWEGGGNYDSSEIASWQHDAFYTEVRSLLVSFRPVVVGSEHSPTPPVAISHVNARIQFRTNQLMGVLTTGVAIWKRAPLLSLGNYYQAPGTVVTGQVNAPEEFGYYEGVIDQLVQTSSTTVSQTVTGQEAVTLYGEDPTLSGFASTGPIIENTETNFVGDQTQTITTIENIQFNIDQVGETNIEFPNENTPGFDPTAFNGAGGIPAWAEVIHHNPEGYSVFSGTNVNNLNYGQELIYGPENTGSWQTYTYTDNNGDTYDYNYYLGSTPSDHPTQYNDYPGEEISTYDGQSLPSFNDGATKYEATIDSSIQTIGVLDGQNRYPYFTVDLDTPMEVGSWYMVDIEYNDSEMLPTYAPPVQPTAPSNIANPDTAITTYGTGGDRPDMGNNQGFPPRIVGCVPVNDAAYNAMYFYYDVNNHHYPIRSFGQIHVSDFGDGNAATAFGSQYTGDLIALPAENTGELSYGSGGNVLRVIFKHKSDSVLETAFGGSKIIIGTGRHQIPFVIKSVNVVDISEPSQEGDFSQFWTRTPHSPALQHALEYPLAFYDGSGGGGYCWQFPESSNYINFATNNRVSHDLVEGVLSTIDDVVYTIKFNISPSPITGDVQGLLYLRLESPIHSDGKTRGVRLYASKAGYYEYNLTMSQNPIGEIIEAPIDGLIGSILVQTPDLDGNILIRPTYNDPSAQALPAGFVGKLDYFEMYATSGTIAGGNIQGWAFSSIDYDGNDFSGPITSIVSSDSTYFENESIILDDAEPGTMVYQTIQDPFELGQLLKVSFKYTSTEDKFEVYYFTPDSVEGNAKGFRFTYSQENVSTTYPFNAPFSVNRDVEIIDYSSDVGEGAEAMQAFNPDVDMVGALVIKTLPQSVQDNTTATIDNIFLTQLNPIDLINDTISYSEDVRGWVSFKDFIGLEGGLSLSKKYFTFSRGYLYQHYLPNATYGSFYGFLKNCHITALLNDSPETIKEFKALNYEGTQSRVLNTFGPDYLDSESYNITSKPGWYTEYIQTNLALGKITEFIDKEDKWYNYIRGNDTLEQSVENLHFQGVGFSSGAPSMITEALPDVE